MPAAREHHLSLLPPETLPLTALAGPSLALQAAEPVAGLFRATFCSPGRTADRTSRSRQRSAAPRQPSECVTGGPAGEVDSLASFLPFSSIRRAARLITLSIEIAVYQCRVRNGYLPEGFCLATALVRRRVLSVDARYVSRAVTTLSTSMLTDVMDSGNRNGRGPGWSAARLAAAVVPLLPLLPCSGEALRATDLTVGEPRGLPGVYTEAQQQRRANAPQTELSNVPGPAGADHWFAAQRLYPYTSVVSLDAAYRAAQAQAATARARAARDPVGGGGLAAARPGQHRRPDHRHGRGPGPDQHGVRRRGHRRRMAQHRLGGDLHQHLAGHADAVRRRAGQSPRPAPSTRVRVKATPAAAA